MTMNRRQAGENIQAKAASLLITEGALVELSVTDARAVVDHMQPHLAKAGEVLTQEGEERDSDFMALVLDGEVTVENSATAQDSMVVSVLGPGSLIGAMGIIDGAARSATCTAATDLALAVLTRDAMTRLIESNPSVAARLLLAMQKRIANHLRDTNRKLMTFVQLSKALQQELEAAYATHRKLLDEVATLKSAAGSPAAGVERLAGAALNFS
jgi:CRP-like cAMP-binding protein